MELETEGFQEMSKNFEKYGDKKVRMNPKIYKDIEKKSKKYHKYKKSYKFPAKYKGSIEIEF